MLDVLSGAVLWKTELAQTERLNLTSVTASSVTVTYARKGNTKEPSTHYEILTFDSRSGERRDLRTVNLGGMTNESVSKVTFDGDVLETVHAQRGTEDVWRWDPAKEAPRHTTTRTRQDYKNPWTPSPSLVPGKYWQWDFLNKHPNMTVQFLLREKSDPCVVVLRIEEQLTGRV